MNHLRAVPATSPRAVAYIRVSHERDDMISPELQERAIRDHCLKSGYELVDIVTDLDLSGRFWKRRQVERVIGMIEARQADVLVVWKMSRVSRNRLDWSVALDHVETAGGRLESATEPIDTTTSSGRFSRGILAELAAFESERAGEQWSETHRRRWRNGLPHSGRPRFGYDYDRVAGYTINPEVGPIVSDMYRRFIDGDTYTGLRKWLEPMALGTMRTHKSISDFMNSGFAAGRIRHHDPACPLPHRTGVTCKRLVTDIGAHRPIISAETYAEYEAVRDSRSSLPPRLKSPFTPFAGLIVCTACGWKFIHHRRKDGTPEYRCGNAQDCPGIATVQRKRIEALTLEWLAPLAENVNANARGKALGGSAAAVERDRLARVAIDADKALTQLSIDFARRLIPEAAFVAARDELTVERDAASQRVADMANSGRRSREQGKAAADLIEAWPRLTDPERHRILKEILVIHVTKTPKGFPCKVELFEAWDAPTIERSPRVTR